MRFLTRISGNFNAFTGGFGFLVVTSSLEGKCDTDDSYGSSTALYNLITNVLEDMIKSVCSGLYNLDNCGTFSDDLG